MGSMILKRKYFYLLADWFFLISSNIYIVMLWLIVCPFDLQALENSSLFSLLILIFITSFLVDIIVNLVLINLIKCIYKTNFIKYTLITA